MIASGVVLAASEALLYWDADRASLLLLVAMKDERGNAISKACLLVQHYRRQQTSAKYYK